MGKTRLWDQSESGCSQSPSVPNPPAPYSHLMLFQSLFPQAQGKMGWSPDLQGGLKVVEPLRPTPPDAGQS